MYTNTCFRADFNECAYDNGGCDHICDNTGGSYICKCNPGYYLQADGLSCTTTPPTGKSPQVFFIILCELGTLLNMYMFSDRVGTKTISHAYECGCVWDRGNT